MNDAPGGKPTTLSDVVMFCVMVFDAETLWSKDKDKSIVISINSLWTFLDDFMGILISSISFILIKQNIKY